MLSHCSLLLFVIASISLIIPLLPFSPKFETFQCIILAVRCECDVASVFSQIGGDDRCAILVAVWPSSGGDRSEHVKKLSFVEFCHHSSPSSDFFLKHAPRYYEFRRASVQNGLEETLDLVDIGEIIRSARNDEYGVWGALEKLNDSCL